MTPFISTFTGRKVNPLDLKVEDISIVDIAHHLANTNRFIGSTYEPVNTAQHSVFVSRLLRGSGWEPEGLFHDAAEAYLGDVTKWVKAMPCMAGYRDAEDRAWEVICEALHIRPEGEPRRNALVEEADRLMVRFEHLRAGHKNYHMFDIPTHPIPTDEEIERVGDWFPWEWRESKVEFLRLARSMGFKTS